ncbi:Uncharacterised protein [Mycobacteroides abscessus subsp. massiliense]|nr:Uncharacterised protein [Mycobacteroides abscessus subsp. massiliense]
MVGHHRRDAIDIGNPELRRKLLGQCHRGVQIIPSTGRPNTDVVHRPCQRDLRRCFRHAEKSQLVVHAAVQMVAVIREAVADDSAVSIQYRVDDGVLHQDSHVIQPRCASTLGQRRSATEPRESSTGVHERPFQVGHHQASEGRQRRAPGQRVRQADQEHRGRRAYGRRRSCWQPDALRRHSEGQEDLGAQRQHRAGPQARSRRRSRWRRLADHHVRGLRPQRRRGPHRVPE